MFWTTFWIALAAASLALNLSNARMETSLGISPKVSYWVAGLSAVALAVNIAVAI